MSDYVPPETYELPGLGRVPRSVAVEICQAVSKQNAAHRKAWEDRQRESGQVWTAVYFRYHSEREDVHFSLEDAKSELVYGEQSGDLSAVGVRLPDGSMLKYSFDWER